MVDYQKEQLLGDFAAFLRCLDDERLSAFRDRCAANEPTATQQLILEVIDGHLALRHLANAEEQ